MSIQRKAFSALKWAAAAKVLVQTASWAATLVIVRLLTPEDYGLMAKVAVVCAIAGTIAELGLETAVVRSIDIAADDLRKICGMSLLFGAVMTAALVAAAPLLSLLFHDPRLTWPIAAASLQIMVASVAVIPSALATRDLSFERLAKADMTAGIAGVAATLLLALLGAGVWALVLGSLLGAVVRSTWLVTSSQRVRPLVSLRGIGEHMKFGLTLVGNRVSYFLVVQSDVLIGSAFLSTKEIGQYAVALQLATLPMSKAMGIFNQIALPVVAQLQADPVSVRQLVLKGLGIISLLAFPLLWGLSAVSLEFVQVLFGPKWLESVPALTILPLIVPLRMLCSVLFTTTLALGRRQLDLRNTIANLILIPCGFYVGAHWGLLGLCTAWLISVPLAYAVSVPAVLRLMGIRALDVFAACGPPVVASGAMYAVIATARGALVAQPEAVALSVLIGAGAVAYLAVMVLISRRHLADAYGLARSFLGRDPTKAA